MFMLGVDRFENIVFSISICLWSTRTQERDLKPRRARIYIGNYVVLYRVLYRTISRSHLIRYQLKAHIAN